MSGFGTAPPEHVGHYDVVGIAPGDVDGSVWRGYDAALGRPVALKRVAVVDATSVQRLRAEARVLARLSHPNVVTVVDLIESGGHLWLVEEWVDGTMLAAVLNATGPLSPVQGVGVVRGALLGLAYAHQHGIVHGDVSPSNVLLDRQGTSRLIDFGLAQPIGGISGAGTPGYASPEAVQAAPLLPASDVYSAAALLASLLKGRPVFVGPTAAAVYAAQFGGAAPDLAGVPAPMVGLLNAALALDPAWRPSDAGEFLRALDEAADQSFGRGWLAGAGVAGLVSATLSGVVTATTGLASAGGTTAGLATSAGAHVTPPWPDPVPPPHARAVRGSQRASQVRRLLHARVGVAVASSVVVAAVTVAAVIASRSGGHPNQAAAVTKPSSSSSPIATRHAAFDLHDVDWRNATYPGRACFQKRDITLHGGRASLPGPNNVAGGGYVLDLDPVQPQYGQLTGGPNVAAFGLTCNGTGTLAGSGTTWQDVAVFGSVDGRPKVLALYFAGDLGSVGSAYFVPRSVRVVGGSVVVAGIYLRAGDGRCCPSGRGTVTVTYAQGTLHVGPVVLGPAAGVQPSATASNPPASPGIGRTLTATIPGGPSYTATVRAEDVATNCAAHSYGTKLIDFFTKHPCPGGIQRRLVTIPYRGRSLALSIIQVDAPVGPRADPYHYVRPLVDLERAPGTGGLDDLLRSGVVPAGWPPTIPANEAFVVTGQDATVDVFDAWYLTGPTQDQDPDLVALVKRIFLTPITTGPF